MPHQTNHLPKRQATRSVPHPLSCDMGPTCYQPSCWLYRPLLSPAPNSVVRTPDLCFLPCPKSLYTPSNSSRLDFCSCPDCVQNSSSFQSPLRSLSKIFFGPPSSPLPHLCPPSIGFPPGIETAGAGAASSTGPAAWHRHFLSPPQCLTSLASTTS